jgi:alpha-tubulin suppressor-like RCC1 family protein
VGTTTRRTVVVVAAVVALGALGGCQTVRPGSRCHTSDFAQAGTWVMRCSNGRWTRFLTKAQATSAIVALLHARSTTTTTSPRPRPSTPPTTAAPTPTTTAPPRVAGPKAVRIATENDHSCAVLDDGTVRCWGDNRVGQLGNGDGPFSAFPLGPPTMRDVPTTVVGITDAVDVGVGAGSSCALLADHTVSCWGDNSVGQLGTDTRVPGGGIDSAVDALVPLPVAGLTDVQQLVVGPNESCAIRTGGELRCWGRGLGGTSISGPSAFTPIVVAAAGPVRAVAVADDHTCAIRIDGALTCWGSNDSGQLGAAPANVQVAPSSATVSGFDDADSIAVDFRSTCVTQDGAATCWGETVDPYPSGADAATASGLALGGCARTASARLGCYQVLDPNNEPWRLGPTVVDQGVAGVVQVSGRRETTCARLADGSVWCLGHNDLGQLGNGTWATSGGSLTPVRVLGIA